MMTECEVLTEINHLICRLFHKLQEKKQHYLSEPESDTEFMEHVVARQQGCDLIFDVFTTADGTALLLLCRTKERVRVKDSTREHTTPNQIFKHVSIQSRTHQIIHFSHKGWKWRHFMLSKADLSPQMWFSRHSSSVLSFVEYISQLVFLLH